MYCCMDSVDSPGVGDAIDTSPWQLQVELDGGNLPVQR
jgi:hypothetical protein